MMVHCLLVRPILIPNDTRISCKVKQINKAINNFILFLSRTQPTHGDRHHQQLHRRLFIVDNLCINLCLLSMLNTHLPLNTLLEEVQIK